MDIGVLKNRILDITNRSFLESDYGVTTFMEGATMPTITVEQFTKWKVAFADGVDDAEQDARFKDWVEKLRPATFLPARIRHRWNDHLKKEIEARLTAWFQQQRLPLPQILSETNEGARRSPDDELRRRLIACVRSMTRDVLERVQIPSSALLRVKL